MLLIKLIFGTVIMIHHRRIVKSHMKWEALITGNRDKDLLRETLKKN